MGKLKVGGLFSGIGGIELGLVRAGFEISWMVEINDFCQKVLRKHAPEYWSNAEILDDIKKVGKHNLKPVHLICGGFPCQPFSSAGNRRGKDDDRFLWPEMFRVIQEIKPSWILGENVAGFINMELENSLADLESEGYKVETFVLPANAIGAYHRRDRVWVVAYTNGNGTYKCSEKSNMEERFTSFYQQQWDRWAGEDWGYSRRKTAPRVFRMDDGIPNRVDRLKSIGNAVVPQIPEILGKAILIMNDNILKG